MLRVAVGAQESALACFYKDFRPSQISERPHVQLKELLQGIDVMEL
jgi:hypothetical protein